MRPEWASRARCAGSPWPPGCGLLYDPRMTLLRAFWLSPILLAVSCGGLTSDPVGPPGLVLPGNTDYLHGFPAQNEDGSVNVVVEIPAGTDGKWEVTKPDGKLAWEVRDGTPRVVQYLGYPGNYGMIPRTLLPKEAGGDGDPLDVLVLGPALKRGSCARVRVIGVLELLDGGEQDDKLLGVMPGTPLGHVTSLAQLDGEFPGVTSIVETWFTNYKGKDDEGQPRMISRGFAGKERAEMILETSIQSYVPKKAAH